MATSDATIDELPEAQEPERLPRFEATPEVIQDLLGRDIDMIRQQIMEGEELDVLAQDVATVILDNRVDYHESFPQLQWDAGEDEKLEGQLIDYLLSQLDQQQMLLREEAEELAYKADRLEEIENDPEKKGLFSRALSKIKTFAWKHKIVTGLLVLALAAGAFAGSYYLAANWEALMSYVGLAAEAGSADATGAMEVLESASELGEYGASGVPSDVGM